jgi:hypothetical protein
VETFYWIGGTIIALVGVAMIRFGFKGLVLCFVAAWCCRCSEQQK